MRTLFNSDAAVSVKKRVTFTEIIRKYNVLITLFALVILATITTKGLFLDGGNLLNVGERASIVGIVALGQMLVILTGGIDLSVGSIMAIALTFVAKLTDAGLPVPLAMLAAILIATIAGFINGVLVSKTKVPPFMITIGTMLFFFSLALLLTGANQLYYLKIQDFINKTFHLNAFGSRIFPNITWFVVSIMMIFILQRTKFGKNVYAVGGREITAKLSGINTGNIKIMVYSLSGLFSSIAALVLAYRLSASNPDAGMFLQLESIAAVIVGGTNINGGEGNVYGTLVGAIIMTSLVNLLNLLNANPFIQDAIKGLLLIFFVFIMQVLSKRH
jgi:ribose transport system permease protein